MNAMRSPPLWYWIARRSCRFGFRFHNPEVLLRLNTRKLNLLIYEGKRNLSIHRVSACKSGFIPNDLGKFTSSKAQPNKYTDRGFAYFSTNSDGTTEDGGLESISDGPPPDSPSDTTSPPEGTVSETGPTPVVESDEPGLRSVDVQGESIPVAESGETSSTIAGRKKKTKSKSKKKKTSQVSESAAFVFPFRFPSPYGHDTAVSEIQTPSTASSSSVSETLTPSTATSTISVESLNSPNEVASDIKKRILKIRLVEAEDFFEIEVGQDLTYDALIGTCCDEFQISRTTVEKIRKLPDTVVRKDADVRRLEPLQKLEIVLHPS